MADNKSSDTPKWPRKQQASSGGTLALKASANANALSG